MSAAGGAFQRHWRLLALLLGLVVVFGALYALRSAVFPFILGLILAYLLLPIISWVEKRLPGRGKWQPAKRVFLIIIIFIILLALVAGLSFTVITAVIDAFSIILQNAPQYMSAGLIALETWAGFLREQIPPEMREELDQLLLDVGATVGNLIRDTFARGVSFIQTTFTFFFALAALPIFLFYILKDSEKLQSSFYSAFPPWLAEHIKNIIAVIEGVLGRYIRAQFMLGFVVGYFTFIGLVLLGLVEFAPALAVFAGLMEMVPVIGPWIGGIAAVIVTLAVAPDKAIWVALLFLVIQLVENNLLVPRIQGAYLHLHPAVIIVLLVLGAYIAGFWGILLAVPLSATVVAIYKYIRHSVKFGEIDSPPSTHLHLEG